MRCVVYHGGPGRYWCVLERTDRAYKHHTTDVYPLEATARAVAAAIAEERGWEIAEYEQKG